MKFHFKPSARSRLIATPPVAVALPLQVIWLPSWTRAGVVVALAAALFALARRGITEQLAVIGATGASVTAVAVITSQQLGQRAHGVASWTALGLCVIALWMTLGRWRLSESYGRGARTVAIVTFVLGVLLADLPHWAWWLHGIGLPLLAVGSTFEDWPRPPSDDEETG